jgi:hypothetical protein
VGEFVEHDRTRSESIRNLVKKTVAVDILELFPVPLEVLEDLGTDCDPMSRHALIGTILREHGSPYGFAFAGVCLVVGWRELLVLKLDCVAWNHVFRGIRSFENENSSKDCCDCFEYTVNSNVEPSRKGLTVGVLLQLIQCTLCKSESI